MDGLSGPVWAVLAVLSAAAALAILHCLAGAVRNEVYVHDLRVKVNRLRVEQLTRLKEMADRAAADRIIEVGGEAPGASGKTTPEVPRRHAA